MTEKEKADSPKYQDGERCWECHELINKWGECSCTDTETETEDETRNL